MKKWYDENSTLLLGWILLLWGSFRFFGDAPEWAKGLAIMVMGAVMFALGAYQKSKLQRKRKEDAVRTKRETLAKIPF